MTSTDEQLRERYEAWARTSNDGECAIHALASHFAAFLAGAQAGAELREAAIVAIVDEEKLRHAEKDSDDPDYDQGYYEAAFEIKRRIKGGD